MPEPFFPSEVTGFLNDLFAVKEQYDTWKAAKVVPEVQDFLKQAGDAIKSRDPAEAWFDLMDRTMAGDLGQELESRTGDFFADMLTKTWDGVTDVMKVTVGQRIKTVLGLRSVTKEESVWGYMVGLWDYDQAERSLQFQGYPAKVANDLVKLAIVGDVIPRLWSMWNIDDLSSSADKLFAHLKDSYSNWTILRKEAETQRPSIPDMFAWYAHHGTSEKDMSNKIFGYGVHPGEFDKWWYATRVKPTIPELWAWGSSGLLDEVNRDRLMRASGGDPMFAAMYEAGHQRRFALADWFRAAYAKLGDPAGNDEWEYIRKAWGMKSTDVPILAYNTLARPSPFESIAAMRKKEYAQKGELPDPKAADIALMQKQGIHPEFIEHTWINSFSYPQIPDLVTMAVRDVFDPVAVKTFELDEGYPDEFDRRAKQLGVPEYWSKKYWQSHWRLPGAEQGFEMLHRGVIEEPELAMLLKVLDYSPFWRDRLKQISYRPYTRVDVRRMYAEDVLGFDDVVKAYKDIGYDEEHAGSMALFTERFVEAQLSTIRSGDIVAAYQDFSIDANEARQYLRMLHVPAGLIPAVITRADYVREENLDSLIVRLAKARFVKGQWGITTARAYLITNGVSQQKADYLGQIWEVEREESHSPLSMIEIKEATARGVLSRDKANVLLTERGYSNVERVDILGDITLDLVGGQRRDRVPDLGTISRLRATNILDDRGVNKALRESGYSEKWVAILTEAAVKGAI